MASSALDSETVPSAPQITRADLAFNERLAQCEQQLQDLRSLVERLERSPSEVTPTPTVPRWFWLLFLATLALAWQIFAHFR